MKNKKAVYVVLPVVIGLWALVIYKVMGIYNASESFQELQASFIPPVFAPETLDTFSIQANYRDPFLDNPVIVKKDPASVKQVTPAVKFEPPKWPVIVYGGMIKSRSSNAQLCMISINGQSLMMKEGDTQMDVLLRKVYTDSVELVFGKERRVVRK